MLPNLFLIIIYHNLFQGAIKSLARETMQKSGSAEGVHPFNVQRVRLLLEFVEQLEKAIYNAADGTATALLTPPKVMFSICALESQIGFWLIEIFLLNLYLTFSDIS